MPKVRTALTVTPVEATDQVALDEAYELRRATRAAQIPDFPPVSRQQHNEYLTTPWPGADAKFFLARDDGRAVGLLMMDLPVLDNLDNAMIEISVPPAGRRRGVGATLFDFAVAETRALGRSRVIGDTVHSLDGGPDRDPGGSEFVVAMGMTEGLRDIRRRLTVSTVDEAEHDRLLAEAWSRADGYSLVQWTDGSPEEYVDDLAILDGRLILDAPMGDLKFEPMKVDADRIRASDAARRVWGQQQVDTGVRHDASGRLVAWTGLHQQANVSWHAWQGITIVSPEHRGHRLGTIVKIENYRLARRVLPELAHIDTWNAAANDYMISINEAVGFRAVDGSIAWQKDI